MFQETVSFKRPPWYVKEVGIKAINRKYFIQVIQDMVQWSLTKDKKTKF